MMDIKETISLDEATVRITATMQYKIGTVNVNGEPMVAVDFMDGKGLIPIDPNPIIAAIMAQCVAKT